MNCSKSGNLICKNLSPSEKDMEAINTLTTRKFAPEEVYCFEVLLCDNDVDRDGECFERQTLEELAELFIGKTGICDHDPKACHQQARIYETHVEEFQDKMTALGEPYCALMAKAYMVRTESNRDLILEIEGGIKKEVSVGCSVREKVCSICQSTAGECEHFPGNSYEGKLCCTLLRGAADAYEWSFVAVPAQPKAGVLNRKDFELENQMVTKICQASKKGDSMTLNSQEVLGLERLIKNLLSDCEELRAKTRREVMTKAFEHMEMDGKTNRELCSMLDHMSIHQMKLLGKMMSGKKQEIMPSQFMLETEEPKGSEQQFMI